MKIEQIRSKQDLRNYYGFGTDKLHRLMNKEYYEDLKKHGYKKTDKLLKSSVIVRFVELHGTRVFTNNLDSIDLFSPGQL